MLKPHFFMLGIRVRKNPVGAKTVVAGGHEIATPYLRTYKFLCLQR